MEVINKDSPITRQTTGIHGEPIAFVSNRDGGVTSDEIYVMDADDGGNLQNLTNNPADDEDPSWSPDVLPLYPIEMGESLMKST